MFSILSLQLKLKTMTATEVMNLIRFKKPTDFITNIYVNNDRTKCCVMGFVNYKVDGRYRSSTENDTSNIDSIRFKSRKFLEENKLWGDIAWVNNAPTGKYDQPTPKARVMALLKDMIAAGY